MLPDPATAEQRRREHSTAAGSPHQLDPADAATKDEDLRDATKERSEPPKIAVTAGGRPLPPPLRQAHAMRATPDRCAAAPDPAGH